MNIFVLNTGRCGSMTFINACKHISNYTAAHESRSTLIGETRLQYPDNHIEADNRLCWFLGRLDREYGNQAFYVHLVRNTGDTADSFSKRYNFGIMKAYREGILMEGEDHQSAHDIALDYIDTVQANIELFLSDKNRKLEMRLDNIKQDFRVFWESIAAQGDIEQALREWDTHYNAG